MEINTKQNEREDISALEDSKEQVITSITPEQVDYYMNKLEKVLEALK